jgi:OFA family oxalate/formate antiporter-like MFS transporter
MPAITQNKQGLKVLITGSILQLFLGILYVWSVFVNPVSEVYAWNIDSVKLTASFMLCFFVVGILIGGKLQTKTGAQKIVLTGGLMLAAGMFATAFLPPDAAWLMYVTYGIIGGFGVGAAYNAIISAAQKWFPQNRGFATGVSVCAFGFSTVIFAPLIEALIAQFGLKNSFLILAAAFFVVVMALFNFIRLPDESAPAGAPAAALLAKKQYTVTEAIKTKEFYFITLSLMFATAAFFILNPSFKTFAAERGFDDSIGTVIVMMTGIASALGRLGAPLLSDKIGRVKAALTIIMATAICALLLCFAQGILFMAAIAVIAFCYGGYSGIYPVLTADYFGIKNVGSNYGAVMVGFAVSALTFPMIIASINDVRIKFYVLASLAAAGVILMVLLMKSKKKE